MLKPLTPRVSNRWPLVVVVRVTSHCPLACLYCGYSREVKRGRSQMEWPALVRFGQLLKDYQEQSQCEILVCWLGGEPYLWPMLWPATDMFRHQFQLAIGVTTSGINLHEPLHCARTLEMVDELTISVDGPAEHHDRVRGGSGSYRQLEAKVRELARRRDDHRLLLRANMVLTRGNIAHVADVCHELAGWGFNEVSFNQLGGLDRPEFFPANRLLPEQVKRFRSELPQLRAALSRIGLSLTGADDYLERITATTEGRALPVEDCQPGSGFWFVDEFGWLAPCSYTSHAYGLSIHQLHTVADLQQIPIRLSRLRNQQRCHACDDCHATHQFAKFVGEDQHETRRMCN